MFVAGARFLPPATGRGFILFWGPWFWVRRTLDMVPAAAYIRGLLGLESGSRWLPRDGERLLSRADVSLSRLPHGRRLHVVPRMLANRVIPCLDVNQGRVVKGTNFLNLRDAGDPVEVAARYEQEGADELVFLDITASHERRDIMLDVVRRTAEVVIMPLTVGGGIRTIEDIRALLNAGSDKVSINSAACRHPEFVRQAARRFGSQCIVVNIDPKRVQRDGREVWEVHINGGRTAPGWRPWPGRSRSSSWEPARSC